MAAYVVMPGETRGDVRYVGGDVRLLAGAEDTDGKLSVVEVAIEGEGPPLHFHKERDELLFVLEGVLTVRVNENRLELFPGASAWIPHGVPHAFSNLTDGSVRVLGISVPGGLEMSLSETANYLASLSSGEAPDPVHLAEISKKYDGGTVVGPRVE